MRVSTSLVLSVFAIFAPSLASPTGHVDSREATDPRPLVESNKLRRVLTRSDLLKQAETLQSFALASGAGTTRGFGGPGHNATINYILQEVSKLSEWYTVELQPFVERYSAATGSLLLDGDDAVFYAARGSPAVKYLKAEIAPVVGEGCNTVNTYSFSLSPFPVSDGIPIPFFLAW